MEIQGNMEPIIGSTAGLAMSIFIYFMNIFMETQARDWALPTKQDGRRWLLSYSGKVILFADPSKATLPTNRPALIQSYPDKSLREPALIAKFSIFTRFSIYASHHRIH